MATFNFPVPEGLLDLLRDFTVAVVQNEPDDLERFAAEYFTKLAAGEDDAASVECSKTRSLEFDESMYVTHVGSDQGLDELSSQKGSTVAASSHVSAAAEEPKEKCPDEAAKCWEKMNEAEKVEMKDCTAEDAESAVGSTSKIERASSAIRDSAVKEDTERESTVRESAVGPNADDQAVRDSSVKGGSIAEGSVARESSVGRGSSLGRESKVRDPEDEVGSIKSAGSALLNENITDG